MVLGGALPSRGGRLYPDARHMRGAKEHTRSHPVLPLRATVRAFPRISPLMHTRARTHPRSATLVSLEIVCARGQLQPDRGDDAAIQDLCAADRIRPRKAVLPHGMPVPSHSRLHTLTTNERHDTHTTIVKPDSGLGEEIRAGSLSSKLAVLTLSFPRLRLIWCRSPHVTADMFDLLKVPLIVNLARHVRFDGLH